jgi:predicted phosphodiesterase
MRLRFGPLDPRWLEALHNYHRFLQRRRDQVPYVPYRSLDDYVLDGLLPASGRVALFADWGTGTAEAVALLHQLASHDPDVVIHLGDIYYSGQQQEVERRFLAPCKDVFPGVRPHLFTLAGNHDMYSGGAPYYWLLGQLGQPASYFCLRNAHWQVIAIDTGRNSDVGDREPTHLQKEEVAWVRDKVEGAGGRRTILLSHHQLFSPYERIGGGTINPNLKGQLGPVLPPDTVWYWGHEHDLILFGPHEGVRGRCIGHGAIPVPVRLGGPPRARIDGGAIPVEGVAPLGRNGLYYNNGYVILEFDGLAAEEVYFQHPGGGGESFRRAL